jgi:hypothetical protein
MATRAGVGFSELPRSEDAGLAAARAAMADAGLSSCDAAILVSTSKHDPAPLRDGARAEADAGRERPTEVHMTSTGNSLEPYRTSTGHDFASPEWLDNHYLAMRSEYEAQVWRQLADTDSPGSILHHPDFHYRVVEFVFVGRVPE